MQQSFEAMKLALRVLTALTEKQPPDPQDVARLYVLAGPQPHDMNVDELACEVIQQALKRRVQQRDRLADRGRGSPSQV